MGEELTRSTTAWEHQEYCEFKPQNYELFQSIYYKGQQHPIKTLEETTIKQFKHCEYKIVPFNIIDKESGVPVLSLPPENQQPPMDGFYWLIDPGQTTRTQLLKDQEYYLPARVVQGEGYFLRLLPPDMTLNIVFASPQLEDKNPIITTGHGCIASWIAAPFSQDRLIVEGINMPKPFDPSYETQMCNKPGSESPPDPYQTITVKGKTHHLFPLWQAQHILRTGSRELVKACYPQIANI